MRALKARLERIERQAMPEIPPDERDPELVQLVRMFDKDCQLELIPRGVSGRRLLLELMKQAEGTTLAVCKE